MGVTASQVFFAPADNLTAAIPKLIQQSGFLEQVSFRQRVGIKIHFGEDGNRNHLSPELVRVAVLTIASRTPNIALIETCTLYRGRRASAQSHIALAHEHGFIPARVMVPIDIIDGDQGRDFVKIPVSLSMISEARLGKRLRYYPRLLNMAHFKGHFVTGYGGVLKNLGMGLAAKAGKLEMHCRSKPAVNPERCVGCGDCIDSCPNQAIGMIGRVARVGRSCSGCAGCVTVCPQGAIDLDWAEANENVSLKVVEYAYAALKGRNALHMNFAINITPNCDCMNRTEKPLMPDVGVFASLDPVACDQAALDRVGNALQKLYPRVDFECALRHAERIGLGSRAYSLSVIPQ